MLKDAAIKNPQPGRGAGQVWEDWGGVLGFSFSGACSNCCSVVSVLSAFLKQPVAPFSDDVDFLFIVVQPISQNRYESADGL